MKSINAIKGTIITLVLTAAMSGLTGCTQKMSYVYKDSENYEAGEREITDKIENLDIDYISGDVTIVSSKSDVATIVETANKDLSDEMQVHTWLDGTTLRVRYCASGKGIEREINLNKKLTITLPYDVLQKEVKLNLTSGDVTFSGIDVENATFDMTSGGLKIETDRIDNLVCDSTSGNRDIKVSKIDTLKIHATSGNIRMDFDTVPTNTNIDVTSGDITLFTTKDLDLSLDYDATSGKMSSDIPYTGNEDSYKFGDGTSQMRIDATSGDLTIAAKD